MKPLSDSVEYLHKLRTEEELDIYERSFAIGAGSVMSLIGMRRGGFGGFLNVMAGGVLTLFGATGINPFHRLGRATGRHVFVRQTVLINQDRDKVYQFWRRLSNLPKIMKHIKKVEYIDGETTHWEAELGGIPVSWDAEIVFEVEDWRISWNSLPESEIVNAGKVEFEHAGANLTKVNVLIAYEPRAGALGVKLSQILNPVFEEEIREDIMKLKNVMENAPADAGE